MTGETGGGRWPALPLAAWEGTRSTLHLAAQMIGKTRLALAPPQNHWWHVTLQVSPRGLRTPPMPAGDRAVELELDLREHALVGRASDGRVASIALAPRPIAELWDRFLGLLRSLDVTARLHPLPSEIPDPVRFDEDARVGEYDPAAAGRYHAALLRADQALHRFRSGFLGKCSPVHFWWGALDLSCTRFSGRPSPPHPGGIPNLPDRVTREAYSHECISAGWWPGNLGGPVAEAAFYAYAWPEPAGCPDARVEPDGARYDLALREWVLPWEAVRNASNPDDEVRRFLASTYGVAARLGAWDRAALERDPV